MVTAYTILICTNREISMMIVNRGNLHRQSTQDIIIFWFSRSHIPYCHSWYQYNSTASWIFCPNSLHMLGLLSCNANLKGCNFFFFLGKLDSNFWPFITISLLSLATTNKSDLLYFITQSYVHASTQLVSSQSMYMQLLLQHLQSMSTSICINFSYLFSNSAYKIAIKI